MEVDLFGLDHALRSGINLGKGRVREGGEGGVEEGRGTLFPQRTMGMLACREGGGRGRLQGGGPMCVSWSKEKSTRVSTIKRQGSV